MGMSDRIEAFIMELLKEEPDQWLELRRNELASVFNCVPSQISYVISTRFCPERGYIVESRRGGSGYLRIRRMDADAENPIRRILQSIGGSLDYPTAKAYTEYLAGTEAIDGKTARLILSAVSDNSLTLNQPEKDRIRAGIMKNMLAASVVTI